MEQLTRQKETANIQSQQQVQQLRQQVSDVIVTSSLLLYSRLQLSVMSIAEGEGGAAPLGGEERGGGAD